MADRAVIGPDGQLGRVDEADFSTAMASGYKPATPQDEARAEAAEHPVQAAVEGVADSATLGLSKSLQRDYYRMHGQDPSQVAQRAEENPVAHGIGEFAGLFTPGPGAVAKVGRAAGAQFAGRTAQRVVAGGVEGGLFGLGAVINEDHMGDPKLTAENVAAGTLASALVGAGVTAGFGKAADIGRSALIKAFGGKAVQETLGGLAEQSLMGHLDADLTKKNLAGRAEDVSRYAFDNGLTKGLPSYKTFAERASERAQGHFSEMEGALDAADQAVKFNPVKIADRLQPMIDEMDKNPALESVQAKLQKFADRFRETGTAAEPGGAVPSTWQKRVANGKSVWFDPASGAFHSSAPAATQAVEGTAPDSFRKAWETTKAMLKQAKDRQTAGDYSSELFRFRKQIQDEMAAQMPPDVAASWQKANSEYSHASTLRNLASDRASASKSLTPGEIALGAVGFSSGGPVGALAPYAKRFVAERGGFAAASALDALSQSGAMPKIAKGFQLFVNSQLALSQAFGGAFRATLETAAAKGAEDLLQTHLSLAQTQPDYMASVGLQNEDPSTVAEHTDRAHRFGQLSNAVDRAGAETDKAIGRALGTQSGRPPASKAVREPTRAEFDALKSKLEKLTGYDGSDKRQLNELAPTTGGLAQMGVVSAAQYLLGTAPKNPTEGLPPALQRPWAPPKGALRAWLRRVDTVADPRSVFDAMRNGMISSEQLETLEQVYPSMYRDFQDRVQSRLSEWKEPLDRKRRGQISQMIGNLDDPAVTQLIQAAHLRSNPPPTGAAPDGREKIDPDKNQQTQAQRLENA